MHFAIILSGCFGTLNFKKTDRKKLCEEVIHVSPRTPNFGEVIFQEEGRIILFIFLVTL